MTTKRTSHRWPSLVLAAAIMAASGCSTSTHFFSKWSAQAQPVAMSGLRVATVFLNDNESIRRQGEDVMAREVGRIGGVGVASYNILPEDPRDRERAKRELAQAGVDAVLSMRVVARERVMDGSASYFTGSPHYGSLWNYWGYGWGSVQGVGYLDTSTIVAVETLLYSLKDEKLLWAGMSETFDPDDVESAVKSIAREAVDEMQDDGVLTAF
jgi:hypothetical protein